MNPHHRRPIALAALGCALALTACGSSAESPAGTAGSSQYAQGVRYSDCMRAHGVPSFPDPTFGPGGEGAGVNFQENTSSPACQTASKACAHVGTNIPGVALG